jgi:hypothetical protein
MKLASRFAERGRTISIDPKTPTLRVSEVEGRFDRGKIGQRKRSCCNEQRDGRVVTDEGLFCGKAPGQPVEVSHIRDRLEDRDRGKAVAS